MNEIWSKYKKKFILLGFLRSVASYCFTAFMISAIILMNNIEHNIFIILISLALFFLLLLAIFGMWYRWIFHKIFSTKNKRWVPEKYNWFFENNIRLIFLWFLQLIPIIDIFFVIDFSNNMQQINDENIDNSETKTIL